MKRLNDIHQLLLERNVVNIEEIDKFVKDAAASARTDKGKNWVTKTFRKFMINKYGEDDRGRVDPSLVVKMSKKDLPKSVPNWMSQAIDKGEELLQVKITDELKQEIEHLIDYLNSHPEERLERVSVPQAIDAAGKWVKTMNKKASDVEEEGGIKKIMDVGNGQSIVEVLSDNALKREGKLMGHCVGSYCAQVKAGDVTIFSLRDSNNQPHATIEVKKNTKAIHQIKGKQNRAPVSKYVAGVLKFINEKKLDVRGDESNVGLLRIKGKLYFISDLPDGAVVEKHSFTIAGKDVVSLPKGVIFTGNLTIDGASLTSLPDGMKVKGELKIVNTPLSKLPEDLIVGESLHLSGVPITELPLKLEVNSLTAHESKISSLPKGFSIDGDLSLEGTKTIKQLPIGMKLGSDLDVENTGLTSLPKDLKVPNGYLNISFTGIAKLPDGLEVGGILDLEGTKVKTLPKNMKIKGKIYHFPGNEADYPQYKFR